MTWTLDDIGIDLTDEFGCWSHSGTSGTSHFEGQCAQRFIACPPGTHRFTTEFRVDHSWDPRPAPFTPPAVRVLVQFIPAGGLIPQMLIENEDANPQYLGPGMPLQPSFGTTFSLTLTQSGNITIVLVLSDSDSGLLLFNTNTIQCTVGDCM